MMETDQLLIEGSSIQESSIGERSIDFNTEDSAQSFHMEEKDDNINDSDQENHFLADVNILTSNSPSPLVNKSIIDTGEESSDEEEGGKLVVGEDKGKPTTPSKQNRPTKGGKAPRSFFPFIHSF